MERHSGIDLLSLFLGSCVFPCVHILDQKRAQLTVDPNLFPAVEMSWKLKKA